MRKINLLLFVIAFIAIGCSGDSPTGPSMGVKGFYSVNVFGVPFDQQSQSWDEASKYFINSLKLDGDISIREAMYDNCYGKNWKKGSVNDNMGAILGVYENDGDSTIYKYNSDNFLIEKVRYSKGVVNGRTAYQNENGKVLTENYYYSKSLESLVSLTTYEYGDNGYIISKTIQERGSQMSSSYEYRHDNNGYLVERKYYPTDSSSDPTIEKYIYNSHGLLIRRENEDGRIFTEYKYNNLGLMSEYISGDINADYIYSSRGLLLEAILYDNGIPELKIVIEYID